MRDVNASSPDPDPAPAPAPAPKRARADCRDCQRTEDHRYAGSFWHILSSDGSRFYEVYLPPASRGQARACQCAHGQIAASRGQAATCRHVVRAAWLAASSEAEADADADAGEAPPATSLQELFDNLLR